MQGPLAAHNHRPPDRATALGCAPAPAPHPTPRALSQPAWTGATKDVHGLARGQQPLWKGATDWALAGALPGWRPSAHSSCRRNAHGLIESALRPAERPAPCDSGAVAEHAHQRHPGGGHQLSHSTIGQSGRQLGRARASARSRAAHCCSGGLCCSGRGRLGLARAGGQAGPLNLSSTNQSQASRSPAPTISHRRRAALIRRNHGRARLALCLYTSLVCLCGLFGLFGVGALANGTASQAEGRPLGPPATGWLSGGARLQGDVAGVADNLSPTGGLHAANQAGITRKAGSARSPATSSRERRQEPAPDLDDRNHPHLNESAAHAQAQAQTQAARAPKNNELLVQSKQGLFRGALLSGPPSRGAPHQREEDRDINVIGFLGIRYASAPIKRLRFMPPTAYNYAPGQVHDARTLGPICWQRFPVDLAGVHAPARAGEPSMGAGRKEAAAGRQWRLQMRLLRRMMTRDSFAQLRHKLAQLAVHEQSEDCLNLNIYTRASALAGRESPAAEGPLPVLVIIHGDSFDFGSGSIVDGARLARESPLIVVTLNYRLNLLGFPPKPAGPASQGGSSGTNLGLLDQIAALHWIRDNIGSFGGAAGNITLMGSKRGAIFVNLLMLSPLAKGLFQRAIMEDGSALTPLIAGGQAGQLAAPGLQHVRQLALLLDCAGPAPTNDTAAGRRLDDALLFECLRRKPVEELLGRVALDQAGPNQGQLSESASVTTTTAADSMRRHQEMVRRELERLELDGSRWAANEHEEGPHEGEGAYAYEDDAYAYEDEPDEARPDEALELSPEFSALYRAPAASLRPLFGPTLDGLLVAVGPSSGGDWDAGAAMLRAGSPFAQRDLLIGLSEPALGAPPELEGEGERGRGPAHGLRRRPGSVRHTHALAERVWAAGERAGLSNEEAVELVGLFARSFYRYHQQEIANSIIGHYLLNEAGRSAAGRLRRAPASEAATERHRQAAHEQRLRLLDSIMGAFQDGLVRVPLLRSALIHATRQLDPLAELFVQQRLERWRQALEAGRAEPEAPAGQPLLESFLEFVHQTDSQRLAAEWRPRATYLYQFDADSVRRRLERAARRLASAGGAPVSSARQALGELTEALARRHSALSRRLSLAECMFGGSGGGSSADGAGHRGHHDQEHGHDHEGAPATQSASGAQSRRARSTSQQRLAALVASLAERLCARYRRLVARFVATGNVNAASSALADAQAPGAEDEGFALVGRLGQLERSCQSAGGRVEAPASGDSHAVRAPDAQLEAAQQTSGPASLAGSGEPASNQIERACVGERERLALDFLQHELASTEPLWEPFTLLGQQLASLPGRMSGAAWQPSQTAAGWASPSSFASASASVSASDAPTLASRNSFWLNFVPALNCSRTQPIAPQLLGVAGTPRNASLLQLNLHFSCQQGARTAQDALELLALWMGKQLEARQQQWRANQQRHQQQQQLASHHNNNNNHNRSSSQNHHSLRMANMSSQTAGQSVPGHEPASLEGAPAAEDARLAASAEAEAATRALGAKITSLVLIGCGLMISVTLTWGAVVVARRRRRSRAALATHQGKGCNSTQGLQLAEHDSTPSGDLHSAHQTPFADAIELHSPGQAPSQLVAAGLEAHPASRGQPDVAWLPSVSPQADWSGLSAAERAHELACAHQLALIGSGAQLCANHSLSLATSSSNTCETIAEQVRLVGLELEQEPDDVDPRLASHQHQHQQQQSMMLSGDRQAMNPDAETPILMAVTRGASQMAPNGQSDTTTHGLRAKFKPPRAGCLVNGSSSETAGGQSIASNSSTLKKRVKISDPAGSQRSRRPLAALKNKQAPQVNSDHQHFCPVHRQLQTQTDIGNSSSLAHLDEQQQQQFYEQTNTGLTTSSSVEFFQRKSRLHHQQLNFNGEFLPVHGHHLVSCEHLEQQPAQAHLVANGGISYQSLPRYDNGQNSSQHLGAYSFDTNNLTFDPSSYLGLQ